MSSFSYTYNLGCAMSGPYHFHVGAAGSDEFDANNNCIGVASAEADGAYTIGDVKPQLSISVPDQVDGIESITLTYGYPYTNPSSCPRVVTAYLDNSISLIVKSVDKYGSVSTTYDFSNLSAGIHYINATAYRITGGPQIVKYIYKKPDNKDKECKKNVGGPVNVATGNMRYEEEDFSMPAMAVVKKFIRYYNSRNNNVNAFGVGWSHTFDSTMGSVYFDAGLKITNPDGTEEFYQDNNADGIYEIEFPKTDHAFVEKTSNTEFIKHDPQGFSYTYTGVASSTKYLTVIADPSGNTINISRDTTHKILSAGDNFGNSLQFTYNTYNRIENIYLNGNLISAYQYSNNKLDRVTFADGTYREYRHNASYSWTNISEVADSNGNVIESHTYDNQDRAVTSEAGPIGSGIEKVTINYSQSDQNIATVTDANGYSSTYTYDESGGVSHVTNISGACNCSPNETNYVYDENLNILEATDKNNNVTEYQNYDTRGNYGAKIEKNSSNTVLRTTTYTYHPSLKEQTSVTIQSVVDPAQNKVTIYDYDDPADPTDDPLIYNQNPTNLVHRVIEQGYTRDINGNQTPFETITAYTYNALGQKTLIDGPRTDVYDVIENLYYPNDPSQGNNRGQLQAVRRYTGPSTYLETTFSNYDTLGNVGTVTDPNGAVITYTYDSRNRLQTTTDQGTAAKTEYVYDMAGNMDYIILPRGNIIDYGYDSYNRLQTIEQKANSVTDPAMAKIKYAYDANGNRTKEETFDETGALQKYEDYNYNNPSDPNRLYKIINPDNTYTEFAYDGNGNKRFAENKLADSATTHKTEYIYDALDRLTNIKQTKDLVGGSTANTTYGYDLQDNLTSVLDGKGNQTSLDYDDMGRLIKSTSPDTGITRYTYDAAGNLKQKKDAKGNIITYTCDSLNRVTLIDYPTDSDITYTYDEATSTNGRGRLTTVRDAAGAIAYHYDSQGRVAKQEKVILGKTYITEYDYDENGNLRGIWYPSGRYAAYRFDRADRIESVTSRHFASANDLALNIRYKPYGDTENWTLGNGLTPSISYDNQYRISGITTGTLFSRDYAPDDVGNITGIDDLLASDKDQTFLYDPLDRLNNATGINTYGTRGFTYDDVGNRLTKTQNANSTTYTYPGSNNQLSTLSGFETAAFTYDANGNITGNGTHTFAYTEDNRIKNVDGAAVAFYVYDFQGRRTAKTLGGTLAALYHYDLNGQLIAETDGYGRTLIEYIYLNGRLLSKIDSLTDTDADGLPDTLETAIGTNPNAVD